MDDLRRLLDDPGGSALGRSLLAAAQADAPPAGARARAARRLGIAAVLAGAGAGSEAGAVAAAWKLAAVLLALGGVVGLAIWQAPVTERATAARPGVTLHVAPTASGGPGGAPAAMTPAMAPGTLETPRAPAMPAAPATSDALDAVAAAGQPPRDTPVGVRVTTTPPPGSPRSSRPGRPGAVPPEAAQLARGTGDPVVPAGAPGASTLAGSEALAPAATVLAPAMPAPSGPEVAAPAEAVASAGAAGPSEVVAPAEAAVAPSRLAAEVALVDRARGHLRDGDYSAALAALAEYHQQFASGDLDAEADVVTIETLIAARALPRARSLGAAFFARFPRSPLAQRVHSLLDRLPK
jgi:hypothetical protein